MTSAALQEEARSAGGDSGPGTYQRRLPVGAEVQPGGGVHFRVWASKRRRVEVVAEPGGRLPLTREGDDGYFSGVLPDAAAGSRYHFLLDDETYRYPDPASRSQPDGVHGPSVVIDPAAFPWTDSGWKGVELPGQVMTEIHFGTFTPEGTYAAAAEKLPLLKEVGITVVEVMPLAEYAGDYGWGYDGVQWFAPTRNHGTPDDFRRFVDSAHALGIGVMMDVVYNHFGPDGNYAPAFSDLYFSKKHQGEWGDPLNFDGPGSGPVREFVVANAGYWIDEFHLDGLRLDAVQAILDDSPEHVLALLTRRAREAAGGRSVIVVNEDEWQRPKHFQPFEQGGFGLDGAWNDDFHHSCRVAATGHAEYYYSEFTGGPQELASAVKRGYLFQGQWNPRQKKSRGGSARGVPAMRFVTFLQNHDQIANSATGSRIDRLTSPGRHRALTALWLLGPGTPMFFQGQEFSASAPFHYFVDHPADLAKLVREGRWEGLRKFGRVRGREQVVPLFDPTDRATFDACKLDWSERDHPCHARTLALHRDLLKIRRDDPTIAAQDASAIDSSVVGPEAFLLRYFGANDQDRLVTVNLGRDLHLASLAEPLLAPPAGTTWSIRWSSDDPRYGGSGTAPLDLQDWVLPGHATLLLAPVAQRGEDQHAAGTE